MSPFGSQMTHMVYYARVPAPFKHFCSVVNGKCWVAEAGYLALDWRGGFSWSSHAPNPSLRLFYDVRIFAGSDSDRNKPLIVIPVRRTSPKFWRRARHLFSQLWLSSLEIIIQVKPDDRLRPHQCLNSVSVGFLNTYPRSGSKDRVGGFEKLNQHNKSELLLKMWHRRQLVFFDWKSIMVVALMVAFFWLCDCCKFSSLNLHLSVP